MALMSDPPGLDHPVTLAFGDMQFSMRTLELRRNGSTVRLQAQPAKILALLLSRPGEIVTREEVRRELWGGPLSYEFDDALNHAVRALRSVLGDEAASPRFVETVPRRGYRFIAPVETVAPSESSRAAESSTGTLASDLPVVSPQGSRSSRVSVRHLAAAAVVLAVTCLLGLALVARAPEPPQVTSVIQLTHFGLAVNAVSDGERLYVQQERGGHSTLVEFPISGGAAGRPIATPFRNVSLLDIAPDHRSLLISSFETFVDPRALWVLPLDGSSPKRVGQVFADFAAWSPDGKEIAFAGSTPTLPSALYIANADGSHVRKLTDAGGRIDGWSPDGSRLRFTRINPETGGMTIWEVGADGSNLRPFLPQREDRNARWEEGQCCGAWTPDGRFFIFRRSTASSAGLWENRESVSLFPPAARRAEIYAPAFRISGLQVLAGSKHIARAIATGSKDDRELMIYDSRRGFFVPLLAGTSALHADFSRDGRSVAYVSVPDLSLWEAKADGSARVQLASAPIQAYYSAWSPDGTSIAAQVLPPGKPSKIYVAHTNGGPSELLFPNEPTGESDPSWSPDGRVLMFIRTKLDSAGNAKSGSAWTIDLKTRKLNRIPSPDDIQSLYWSPNGRYAVGTAHSSTDLMVFDFNTRKWKKIASGVFLFCPRWSADSSTIYYQDTHVSEEQPIYEVNVSTGKVRKVAGRTQLLDPTNASRFSFTGLAPNGEPAISVVHSRADVYALQLYFP